MSDVVCRGTRGIVDHVATRLGQLPTYSIDTASAALLTGPCDTDIRKADAGSLLIPSLGLIAPHLEIPPTGRRVRYAKLQQQTVRVRSGHFSTRLQRDHADVPVGFCATFGIDLDQELSLGLSYLKPELVTPSLILGLRQF